MITLHNEVFSRDVWGGVETVSAHKNDVATAYITTGAEGEFAISVDLYQTLTKVVAEDREDFVSVEFTNGDGDSVALRLTLEHAEALWRVLSAIRDGDAASAETRIES